MVTRPLLVLVGALALAGCGLVAGGHATPSPLAEDVAEPEVVAATSTAPVEPAATATERAEARDLYDRYGSAYDELYAAMEPSDALIDSWNDASSAEDWTRVRELSGALAESLRELQTAVLAMDWPEEAAEPAQEFAAALENEIDWYSYVSIARDEAETLDALQQPWTDAAVTASEELWSVLEAGLGLE